MTSAVRSLGLGRVPFRTLDIRPDDVDARDYLFSPSLTLLPEIVDPRWDPTRVILDQKTEGACVGFALAAVINASLLRRTLLKNGGKPPKTIARKAPPEPAPVLARAAALDNDLRTELLVSPRMLYEMAQRYDEWPGQSYEGTTLRAGMKGWHKHGVCSEKHWPYNPRKGPGHLTPERATNARTRPLGAYFRLADNDVAHLQAAIVEADAVLASAWVHAGWESDRLLRDAKTLDIARIRPESRALGLHAFAIVGYCPEGFIIQNSWSDKWGSKGLAVLSYEDWMENRQDAWVARPGPETWDHQGSPRIFVDAFMGAAPEGAAVRAGTSGVEGLGIAPAALACIVNTGDRGKLSDGGRLQTPKDDLPAMSSLVRLARVSADGRRDIVLYAHGGLNDELAGARKAGHLWDFCRDNGLAAWFFVWETGIGESLLGYLRSRDDAAGPLVGKSLGGLWNDLKSRARKLGDKLQAQLGAGLAPLVRLGWQEMRGRAKCAARLSAQGGAALFADALLRTMAAGAPAERYRIHLVGHSAGAIYLGHLYDSYLRDAIDGSEERVTLGSVSFMAPAISVAAARAIFAPRGRLPVPPDKFAIWTLSPDDEKDDEIGIYPGSLLTYVADHLESPDERVPILGIRKDLKSALSSLGSPTLCAAQQSTRHGEFDDPGHEVETILRGIAGG